ERSAQHIRFPLSFEIKMCNLADGMNAGISAARTVNEGCFPGKARQSRLEHRLHAGTIGLCLPADEGAAIIFYGDLVARHRLNRFWSPPQWAGRAERNRRSSRPCLRA